MKWQDLKANPRLKNIYDERIKIIRLTREFFWRAGFLESGKASLPLHPFHFCNGIHHAARVRKKLRANSVPFNV